MRSDEALTAKLAEYNVKRQQIPDNADGHWELALWCEKKGLKAEATAHLIAVTQFDPKRDEAWEHLGCRLYEGRWLNPKEIAAEVAEYAAQDKADAHWEPFLAKWWREWNCGDSQREAADRAFASVTDPRAVPAIRRVLCTGDASQQQLAVQLLGQIDSARSSQTLAALVLNHRSAAVRDAALLRLKSCHPRDFMDGLIGSLRPRIAYRVQPVGQNGGPGKLVMEGGGVRRTLVYNSPPALHSSFPRSSSMAYDGFGNPAGYAGSLLPNPWRSTFQAPFPVMPYRTGRIEQAIGEARSNAVGALTRDVFQLDRFNREVDSENEPLTEALETITGRSLGNDPESWREWWFDQVGYQYDPPAPVSTHRSCTPCASPSSV